jgi:diguanylate cyclase
VSATEATDLQAFMTSAQQVVDYLSAHSPLSDWSVSRVANDEQVLLHVHGDAMMYVGARGPWEDSFCRRMLGGAAPVVPDSQLDPDYADLPAAALVRAYAGVPLTDSDGSLFGTLCGVSDQPLDASEQVDHRLLEVFAVLLSAQLALVRSSAAHHESARAARALARSDRLTGLLNRRGWDLVVAEAQQHLDVLGDPAAVLMIDLDNLKSANDSRGHQAGDALISAAAGALRTAARAGDQIARYGGDEFAVYSRDVTAADLAGVAQRFADALTLTGIAASIGAASVGPGGIEQALAEADASMYADKAGRRAGGRAGAATGG